MRQIGIGGLNELASDHFDVRFIGKVIFDNVAIVRDD
jgi:hypothetical protein